MYIAKQTKIVEETIPRSLAAIEVGNILFKRGYREGDTLYRVGKETWTDVMRTSSGRAAFIPPEYSRSSAAM
ncbi:hypothetical protein [Corallococcus exiguus]|uniref:Uncharacterized protein n=1 Tax=Corallococcus exiguus TaxID=83462 RepID=A0A7X5BUG3_9BACT|nr:hypothetical protein [Corallococcus exiguus]NBC41192.1 hypothetical protein [Corallococcus exiguus]TNV55121.1 hypothetical protein FH620_31930 [Corallococcus exiguus]